jgi:hypothetical protein
LVEWIDTASSLGPCDLVRAWFADGLEVEFGFTTPDWAAAPLDEGTRRVVRDGLRVLFDRADALTALNPPADSARRR